jgi:O-Antigen ligase
MNERWQRIAWTALLVQIPFELKYTLAGLSNLQWTFIALTALSITTLYRNREKLKADRVMQAAALLIAIQWAVAFFAPEFNGNAWKGAMRFSIGLALMAMARLLPDRNFALRVWAITAFVAAVYALMAQEGLSVSWLFRDREFFVAQIQRLSGSFEYPNIAAAYFALSLPIVWWTPLPRAFRRTAAVILSCALILTFSRGAAVAVAAVCVAKGILSYRKPDEWRMAAGLIAAGLCGVVCSALFSPYLVDVLKRTPSENPPSAQYTASWSQLREEPGADDTVQVHIQNTGKMTWFARGAERVIVGYRWRNTQSQRLETGALVAEMPHDVHAGEAIDIAMPFQTPRAPGSYLLIVELFVRKFDWFSNAGVRPVVIEAEIQPGLTRSVDNGGSSRFRPIPRDPRAAPDSVPRSRLWHAAIDMFRAHPFGVGPDNYRLMYGRYLGFTNWNTNIYSNNLYLELLTGSGILGLAAFGLVIFPIRRCQPTPAVMAIAVFLVHGLIDVFLMTTPIYFAFWTLAGFCRESANSEV